MREFVEVDPVPAREAAGRGLLSEAHCAIVLRFPGRPEPGNAARPCRNVSDAPTGNLLLRGLRGNNARTNGAGGESKSPKTASRTPRASG